MILLPEYTTRGKITVVEDPGNESRLVVRVLAVLPDPPGSYSRTVSPLTLLLFKQA